MAFTHQKFHYFQLLPYYSYSKSPQFKLQTLEISTSSPKNFTSCSYRNSRVMKSLQAISATSRLRISNNSSDTLKPEGVNLLFVLPLHVQHFINGLCNPDNDFSLHTLTPWNYELITSRITLWSLKPSFNKICCISVSPGIWNDYCEASTKDSEVHCQKQTDKNKYNRSSYTRQGT